jgi:hypothetical protein
MTRGGGGGGGGEVACMYINMNYINNLRNNLIQIESIDLHNHNLIH